MSGRSDAGRGVGVTSSSAGSLITFRRSQRIRGFRREHEPAWLSVSPGMADFIQLPGGEKGGGSSSFSITAVRGVSLSTKPWGVLRVSGTGEAPNGAGLRVVG